MSAEVLRAYTDALQILGNPASTHTDGQLASAALEQSRREIADYLGCDVPEVIFTSGGTESINLALKGIFWAAGPSKNIIMLPVVEHHATLETVEWLAEHHNAEPVWLPVNEFGVCTPETLREAIVAAGPEKVALVTYLWANNEVGSLTDVKALSEVASEFGVPVHIDAVAALGQVKINFKESGATMLSVSAHKVGGPVGVGALIAARSAKSEDLFHGGSQQRFRAGTQDVAGAVAFAKALDLQRNDAHGAARMRELRDKIVADVLATIPEARLRGAADERLPGNAHFTFEGCQGDSLLFLLDAKGVSVSVGSACQAGVQEISHVLLGMGISEQEAIGSLRMTLAHSTTPEEVARLLEFLPAAVVDAKKAGISSIETTF